jgi:hypothetical protein
MSERGPKKTAQTFTLWQVLGMVLQSRARLTGGGVKVLGVIPRSTRLGI